MKYKLRYHYGWELYRRVKFLGIIPYWSPVCLTNYREELQEFMKTAGISSKDIASW